MDELERRKSILMLAVLYKRMGEDGECGDDLKVVELTVFVGGEG
jgi:hypothetical protein